MGLHKILVILCNDKDYHLSVLSPHDSSQHIQPMFIKCLLCTVILIAPELSSVHMLNIDYLLFYLFLPLNIFYLNVFSDLILHLFPSYVIFSFIIIIHSEA